MKISFLAALLTISAGFGVASAARASPFELEGVYRITERGFCDQDRIDSVILFANARGDLRALFSSAEFTIVYQIHELTWSGNALSGSSLPTSPDAALFQATLSADRMSIDGTVNSTTCLTPWSFHAERVAIFDSPVLAAVSGVQAADYFVGDYFAETDSLEGQLRLVRLADGRVAGNFGNDTVRRLIQFDEPLLDTETNTLELFSYDGPEVRIKWRLSYGLRDGRLVLQGYGLSATGRIYPVIAARL